MYNTMHYFSDLDTIVDDVYDLFACWQQQHTEQEPFSLDTLLTAQMAVHEWVANLKRHARFAVAQPRVGVCVSPSNNGLACVVEDNSVGFDLAAYLADNPELTDIMPERGMGLHWINACANDLRYQQAPEGGQQLAFFVGAIQDPCLDIQFS